LNFCLKKNRREHEIVQMLVLAFAFFGLFESFRLATKFAETFPIPKLTKHRRQKSLIASSCKKFLAFNF